jgi:hypothetical protein
VELTELMGKVERLYGGIRVGFGVERSAMRVAGRVAVAITAGAMAWGAAQAQDGPPIAGNTVQFGMPQVNQQRALATVTGRVTCSDTQRAARFATVTLIGADQTADNNQGRGGFGFGRRVTARTDMDGNFAVQAEPGDYYITAAAMGYASPVAEAASRLRSGSTAADLLASLPAIHVAEAGGATANIALDRGAVIQGKLQWDDGTPATGVNVSVQPTTQSAAQPNDLTRIVSQLGGGFGGGLGGFQTSDDRGVFRITGLAPGSYWVRATMMTPAAEPGTGTVQRVSSIVMYAPGKVRQSDAQVVTLKSGEERDDVQFVLDLSTLHSVSGHVGSTDQNNIAAGVVRLTDSQDSSLTRMAMIQPDGNFVVQWVPAGNYTLAVSNASNVPSQGFGRRQQSDSSSSTSYAPFQESLTVTDTDLSGVGVTLTPATGSQ